MLRNHREIAIASASETLLHGSAHRLWDVIDAAVVKVGMPSLKSRAHLPTGLLCVLYEHDNALCHAVGHIVFITDRFANGAGI